MNNPESVKKMRCTKSIRILRYKTDPLISARRPVQVKFSKKKNKKKTERTCRIVNFAVSADDRVKVKESEKKDKYLDLTRELKNRGI